MSGHSHAANIAVKKAKTDAIKGRIFTKVGREIAVAAKNNPDPNTNSKLADAIAKAKAVNMPNDNIKRCIAKAAGELSNANYEELTYEGYGPSGSAVIIKALTDNKNRTVDFIRTVMRKHGGSLGNAGCVSFTFTTMGIIVVEKTPELTEDAVMEMALDAGADDFTAEDDAFEIHTSVADFSSVRKELESKGLNFFEAEIRMVPQTKITLDGEELAKFKRLIDALEDLDDVSDVYHNVDLPDDEEDE